MLKSYFTILLILTSKTPPNWFILLGKKPIYDYGDIIYDQVHNASFHQKLQSIQCNACLAITGGIHGSSKEKLYQELGLESLQQCRWYRKLCSFYKVFKNEGSSYLFNIVPIRNPAYSSRNHVNIPLFKTNHIFFKISFFHLPLSNGIISTPIRETQILMELSKTPF